jgi:hypothetical protein
MNTNLESEINNNYKQATSVERISLFNHISTYFDNLMLKAIGHSERIDNNVSQNNYLVNSSFYKTKPKVDWKYVQGIELK